MAIKVGINGYGRIGRNMLRALYEGKRTGEIQIVAINDLGDAKTNAHLTRYDTVHGRFQGEVKSEGDAMVVNGDRIRVFAERDPAKLPWGEVGAEYVLECTGLFTSKAKASAHIKGGAKKVVISAPGGEDVDATIVYGVNHKMLKSQLYGHFQRLLHDQLSGAGGQGAARQDRHRGRPHDHHPLLHQRPGAHRRVPLRPAPRALGHHVADPDQDRRGRRGGTGAAGAQGQARWLCRARADHQRVAGGPDLHRRNAPLPSKKSTGALQEAADGPMKGILAYNEAPLVSVDFNHDAHSSIFDATLTKVIDGTLVKVCAWYDNEWGFSNRMLDTTLAWSKAS